MLRVKFAQQIDPYIVNNMPAPVEKLTWFKRQPKPKNKKQKEQTNQKPVQLPTHVPIEEQF